MPPKTKKHSKAQSRLLNADQSASPQTPCLEASEDDILRALDEASREYPALIAQSAIIGKVSDVERENKGCKIWLSESSMVAASLSPGSIVSVSLASLTKDLSSGFPLSSLANKCAASFGVDMVEKTVQQLGDYFAVATVFPSSKVMKDEVRLSSNLCYTMGCPTSGSVVFVYPIPSQLPSTLANGTATGSFPVFDCKELYLELAVSKNKSTVPGNMLYSMNFPAEKRHDPSDSGIFSSPKTPIYQSKLGASRTYHTASPICGNSMSCLPTPSGSSIDSFDIKEAIGDQSAKKLLQTCARTWLFSRHLLCGNFVAIPMLSELLTFRVIGAKQLSIDSGSHNFTSEKSHDLHFEAAELINHVKHDTEIYLHLPSDMVSETSQKGGFSGIELESKDVRANVISNNLKLGGLSKEYAVLKDIIISSSVKDTLSSFGLRTTKGVLLHGPPGTGKTSLAQICARDAGVKLFSVNGPETVSKFYGESEKALHKVFESASRVAPAVVFIDELDAIAPARKDGGEELSQRMVATLLNLMDGINRTDGLIVVAATNRPDSIEPALRRPGRLDREIEIGVPSPKQRFNILLTLLSEMDHSLLDMQVQHLATVTHGFVGADLASLCNEAALVCLRRYVKFKNSLHDSDCSSASGAFEGWPGILTEESDCLESRRDVPSHHSDCTSSCVSSLSFSSDTRPLLPLKGTTEHVDHSLDGIEEECRLKITFEDFEKARMKVRPSAMREVILEVPKVKWEDVGGQSEVKMQLMEAVEWPQKHQDAFKRIGTRPPTGVLMFGPPGCSKTLMARAVASEAGLNFLSVKGPELFSKWVGESEKAVRSLFAKARANAPSIIFFDEIDGLATIRGKESDGVSVSDRVMSQLLVELDGLHQRVDVTVVAATNRPDKIDPALLRPGRFDRLLYVGPPNNTDREEIFRIHLRKISCGSDISIKELASLTEGFTGADISLVCREAAVAAIEEHLDASEVTMRHFKAAIRHVQPSEIHSYEELSASFQRLVHSTARKDD